MWMMQLAQHGHDFDFFLDDSDEGMMSIHKQFFGFNSVLSSLAHSATCWSSDAVEVCRQNVGIEDSTLMGAVHKCYGQQAMGLCAQSFTTATEANPTLSHPSLFRPRLS